MAKKKTFINEYASMLHPPVGRAVFCNVDKPEAFGTSVDLKFNVTLVVKPSKYILEVLIPAVEALGPVSFPDWATGNYRRPYETGAQRIANIEKNRAKNGLDPISDSIKEMYLGNYILVASSKEKYPPSCYKLVNGEQSILDRETESDLKRIADLFYRGAYLKAALTPFTYSFGNSEGVALGLKGLLHFKDGRRLGVEDPGAGLAHMSDEDMAWEDEVASSLYKGSEAEDEIPDEDINV